MHPNPWTPAGRPGDHLRAPGVVLHRWCPADAGGLLAVVERSRDHLMPFMPWARRYDAASAAEYLRGCEAAWTDREHFDYRIAAADGSERILGCTSLMARIGPGALEIGYWVRGDRVRRGIATHAAAALTVAGLALPGVDRIEIHHDVANAASAGVPIRLGYRWGGECDRLPGRNPDGEASAETGRLAVWVLARSELPGSAAAGLVARGDQSGQSSGQVWTGSPDAESSR